MNTGKDYVLLHNSVYTLIIHWPFKETVFKFGRDEGVWNL